MIDSSFLYEELIRLLDKAGRVLVLGCSEESFPFDLQGMPFEFWGADLNNPECGGLNFMLTDPCRPGFGDDSFDYVLANNLLNRLRDVNGVIAESYRLLKAGGSFIFSVINPYLIDYSYKPKRAGDFIYEGALLYNHYHSHKGFEELLAYHGFTESSHDYKMLPEENRSGDFIRIPAFLIMKADK